MALRSCLRLDLRSADVRNVSGGQPKRVSVAGYIVVGFGAVILALLLMLTSTTTTSFRRERLKSVAELRVAAQYTADNESSMIPATAQTLRGVASDPAIASFDSKRCATMMAGFAGYASQASAFVLDPTGTLVCSLDAHRPVPIGDWVTRTRGAADGLTTDVVLDEAGHPQTVYALAVPPGARDGGALVVMWDNSTRPLPVPADMARGVEVMELDKTRTIVVAASRNAAHQPGAVPANSWLRKPLGAHTTRTDTDGVARIYQEVYVDGLDHYVLAAIPKHAALVEARAELRGNLLVASAVMLLVTALGFLMHRRIAKPIRSLKDAIVAAADQHTPHAAPEGPAEIAAVADAFNATMNERGQLERDLADALKAAQRASKLKSEFLANMSHEIRTPMNGVLGMLSLLEHTDMSEEVRDCLRTMGDSAGSLMAILNELLDFSKLEAGMLSTERVEFDVREVLRSAISPWVVLAGRKNVALVGAVEPDVPESVVGDPTRVRQILANLTDNAVKFTSTGRITVTAKKLRGDVVRFEVKDSGIGISEDARAHLFEPFVQADGTTTRRYGGTGLGLAICKQLAEIMGGRIGVDSVAGTGSTFWFELPLPAADGRADATDAPKPAAAGADDGAARVLVVDDNVVNQKVATQMMRKLGYDVTTAGDGVEALRAIDAGEFDFVLMDVQMPIMDGWEATTELRRRGCTIPVIAMTASALEEDRTRCQAVGMDGYVIKPMDIESLNTEIGRVRAAQRDNTPAAVR